MKELNISIESGGWYKENEPDESMKFIQSCGFEGVDYDIGRIFKLTFDKETLSSFFDQSLDELYAYYAPLKSAAAKNGIIFSQLHSLFPIYYADQPEMNAYLINVTEKMIAVCRYLGCDLIVVHPWSNTELHKSQIQKINLDIYRQLIPAAKQYNVTVCLENLYTLYVDTYHEGSCSDAEEACMYLDTLNAEAGKDVFGFCFDVGHANMVGKNVYQYITTLGKRLTTLHIHDNVGTCDAHMIPYTQRCMRGKGSAIDWTGFLNGLKEINYKGPISFETSRVLTQMPNAVHHETLKLISAIGRYYREELQL